jgi:hypothetical protein
VTAAPAARRRDDHANRSRCRNSRCEQARIVGACSAGLAVASLLLGIAVAFADQVGAALASGQPAEQR